MVAEAIGDALYLHRSSNLCTRRHCRQTWEAEYGGSVRP